MCLTIGNGDNTVINSDENEGDDGDVCLPIGNVDNSDKKDGDDDNVCLYQLVMGKIATKMRMMMTMCVCQLVSSLGSGELPEAKEVCPTKLPTPNRFVHRSQH